MTATQGVDVERLADSFAIDGRKAASLTHLADSFFTDDIADDSGAQILFFLYLMDVGKRRTPRLLATFVEELGEDAGKALEWLPREVCADLIRRSGWNVGKLKAFINRLYYHKSTDDMSYLMSAVEPEVFYEMAASATQFSQTVSPDMSFRHLLSEISKFQLLYYFDRKERYIITEALMDEAEVPACCSRCGRPFHDGMYLKRLFYDPLLKEAHHESCCLPQEASVGAAAA
jgi:hypothetical protein